MWQPKRIPKTIFVLCLPLLIVAAGCGSDTVTPPAPSVISVGPDLAPPTAPVGLAAVGALGHVKLAWRANTIDADLVGYCVYRESFGVTRLLAEVDATTIRWIDHNPQVGTYRYAVTAVDEAGNESAWTSVFFTTELSRPGLDRAP